MDTIRRLDNWIGASLLHPELRWICRAMRITPSALHRFIWLAVALHALATIRGNQIVFTGLIVAFALTRTISAGLSPDRSVASPLWCRIILLLVLVQDLAFWMMGQRLTQLDLDFFGAWIAEYAATMSDFPGAPGCHENGAASGSAGMDVEP